MTLFKKILRSSSSPFSFTSDDLIQQEEPIRAEIFSAERLEAHAVQLASSQKTGSGPRRKGLAAVARENGRILVAAHSSIENAAGERRSITSAAEWLLDNLHVIEENVVGVIESLPRRVLKALPKLSNGEHAGEPRIYELCWEFAAHTDNHFDVDLFMRFVSAYQRVQLLTMAELWTLPVIMRTVMIEHLRRVAVQVVKAQAARQASDEFANELIAIAQTTPENQQPAIVLPTGRLRRPFVVQLVQRLRYQQPGFTPLLDALGTRLVEQGLTIDDIVLREHTAQVAANQTIRNIITSMRAISAYDWRMFFESVSAVEQKLLTLPNYAGLDFLTRDRYRKIIQQIALNAHYSEQQIADALVRKIESHRAQMQHDQVVADERALDPGHYLLGRGRTELEAELDYKPHSSQKVKRHYIANASLYYPLTIWIAALTILALPLISTYDKGVPAVMLALLVVGGFFPATDIAITLVNKILMRLFWPRHLPRLELASISESVRTFVAVPVMLGSEEGVEEEIQQLETHYLANQDGEVYFTLLSDWTDADQEHKSADLPLLEAARRGIARLNERYGPSESGLTRFYVLHRRRLWNAAEGKWMGWERKRGKLHEFNRLLRNANDTSFLPNDVDVPPNVRYVVTLDADTRMPIGALRALVGVAAHPLNQPRHDPDTRQVVEGYGILQPRITPTLPTQQERTLYRRFFSARGGIDPYGGAISDVYQDVFGWGSYSGKGLYDVDAFELALSGKVPENTMLSHDLFEGALARVALVNDVELFEDFPSHVEEAAARQHRWTRGDWQLLPWLLHVGRVSMPVIDRLKIIDNMRRSLIAPAILLTLVTAFCLQVSPAWPWLVLAIVGLASGAVFQFLSDLLPHRDDLSLKVHWQRGMAVLPDTASVVLISLALLTQHAWLMLDAIARTMTRLVFTRRKLLEWMTSAQVRKGKQYGLSGFIWRMKSGPITAIAIAAIVASLNPAGWMLALPFVLLWLASPAIARGISLPPIETNIEKLEPDEEIELRLIARRTWRFFTTFVGPKDHYLPPDNFQEDPKPVIAHRTSPTNFGLYLLSVATAHDFGWIGLNEMMRRLEQTMGTLQGLPRLNGHFFNWYETERLEALSPRYVSTVDSGNLAGHLFVLAQACKDAREMNVLRSTATTGIGDTVLLLRFAIEGVGRELRTQTVSIMELRKSAEQLGDLLKSSPLPHTYAFWLRVAERSENLFDLAQAFSAEVGLSDNEVLSWATELRDAVRTHCDDFIAVVPWAQMEAEDVEAKSNAELWHLLNEEIDSNVALEDLPGCYKIARREAARLYASQNRLDPDVIAPAQYELLDTALAHAHDTAVAWCERLHVLEQASRQMAMEMDFRFLLSPERKLFSIGYNVDEARLDDSYYDLLASEARLASMVAIAERQASPSHWFRLGRRMLSTDNGPVLASWSGSMFEYLMPSLVISTPRGSLLDQTCRGIITRQIEYARERKVPWGISESAMNLRDHDFTYQYSAFGVPGLGLKRGLERDVVVAPYATGLAAMYLPKSAAANFRRLIEIGALGRYGFYEALDFTTGRRAERETMATVRAYMAHHQGMLLVSLGNVINRNVMRRRFHREPIIRAAELLLHESMPRWVRPVTLSIREERERPSVVSPESGVARVFDTAMTATPETQLLSNGRYAVMLTAAGSGYSLWNKLGMTRWREDATRDQWGSHLYLRDAESGKFWSAGYQPTAVEPDSYLVKFSEDRARIMRSDGSISSMLEIIVSPEDDAELRRLTLTNNGSRTRHIEVTSYMEILLAPVAADVAHPAFSNLFVETEYLPEVRGLLASRRPRKDGEPRPWAAHVVARGEGSDRTTGIEYETDRARFIGRGQSIRNPRSISDGRPLSNTVGAVLDPIFSLRVRVKIEPGEVVHLVFATMAANSREEIISLADKYHDGSAFSRISALVWTHAQVQLHYLRIEHFEAELFQHMASRILFSDLSSRASGRFIRSMRLSHAGLWGQGISGDRPIVLLRMGREEDLRLVSQLLRAHEYWRMKQLPVDLVILNEKSASYAQELQLTMENMVRNAQAFSAQQEQAERGGAYIVRADLITDDERTLLLSAARVVLEGGQGSLAEQMQRPDNEAAAPFSWLERTVRAPHGAPAGPMPQLALFNGLGGFDQNGREYVIVLGPDQVTPAPWINVIANPEFGFTVSERGAGYTWSLNSRENKLTPWSNDPVSDPSGEAFYLRDEESGTLWSPTASPIRVPDATYTTRHGQGYSRFELTCSDISSELLQFVSWDDPVKICRLRLKNLSHHPRRLSLTSYVEWAMGATRTINAPFIVTEHDAQTGAMFARNPWNIEFGQRVSFIDLIGKQVAWTGDRKEFIGRNGTFQRPAGLIPGSTLSNRVGAGFDPCGALQTFVEILPGAETEIVFVMGQADNVDNARLLVQRYREAGIDEVFATSQRNWNNILHTIQVETPDRSMDYLLNGWLLYQTLSCRFWARTAFYQAGGAYGFRDQLQDTQALAMVAPALAREQILRASSRQFPEGDVQHWWHPPSGRGVRTHISDDLIWLPYCVAHYTEVTGDTQVYDEMIPFLEGELLPPEKEDAYFEAKISDQTASVYEHCARALDYSLKVGPHGLPLMGGGDWNDGMNRVGHAGKGESVWLAWFLYATLLRFAPVAESRGDHVRVKRWRDHAVALKQATEEHAWDGAWYRRAYFDDGTPLGSASNAECRIDSIAQSWSVISGAGEPARSQRAMESVDQYLIRPGDDLILLFTPPFDKTPLDPGYIKGYLPGVRENGGQYTHAAVWCLIAYSMMGKGQQAHDLFRMINPANRTSTRTGMAAYKVEPYAVAADIYAESPHVRRGGWTWYTGAAGWLYRAGTEFILGLKIRGDQLSLDPCLPPDWRNAKLRYRFGAAFYDITINNPHGVSKGIVKMELDGVEVADHIVSMIDDGVRHAVTVTMGVEAS